MERSIDVRNASEVEVAPDLRRLREDWFAAREVFLWALLFIAVIALAVLEPKNPRGLESGRPVPWVLHLQRMEEALARQDVRGAIRPWNEAYSAALKSEGWEGMAAVGAAYFRLVERVGEDRRTAALTARPIVARGIFESVLTRAHQQGSVEGALRAAEGFTAIGDAAMAERCREVASRLVANRPGSGR